MSDPVIVTVTSVWGMRYDVSLADIAMVSVNPASDPDPCDVQAQFWLKSHGQPIQLDIEEGRRLRGAWLEYAR